MNGAMASAEVAACAVELVRLAAVVGGEDEAGGEHAAGKGGADAANLSELRVRYVERAVRA